MDGATLIVSNFEWLLWWLKYGNVYTFYGDVTINL